MEIDAWQPLCPRRPILMDRKDAVPPKALDCHSQRGVSRMLCAAEDAIQPNKINVRFVDI